MFLLVLFLTSIFVFRYLPFLKLSTAVVDIWVFCCEDRVPNVQWLLILTLLVYRHNLISLYTAKISGQA